MNDSEQPLIVPQKAKSEPDLPESALILFTPQDIQLVRTATRRALVRLRKLYLSDLYVGAPNQAEIAVVGPMLGAPQAVLVLEKMIALGVRRFVALGWCGSLTDQAAVGDIIVPDRAVSEEGTSRHYPVEEEDLRPDPDLTRRLHSVLAGSGRFTLHRGGVWSIDAPYRETREKVERYRQEGLLGVEMECSALFAVARYRSVKLTACLVVSDDLSSLAWRPGYRDQRFQDTRKRLPPYLFQSLT